MKRCSAEVALRLALQRALLCEVSANLRMVAADWDQKDKQVVIYFYYDGKITPDNQDSANSIGGEVMGDFDEEIKISEKCILLNSPEELPSHMCTVYRRKEL